MADTITLKELKAGDIILFSVPTDDWISKIIGKLTHSSVSHTGMVDRDHSKVIEEKEHFTSADLRANRTRTRLLISLISM